MFIKQIPPITTEALLTILHKTNHFVTNLNIETTNRTMMASVTHYSNTQL